MTKTRPARARKAKTSRSIKIERGIYRVDYPSHRGIRAYLKFRKLEFQKVFSFAGGEKKALAAARRWRRERLNEIQQLPEAQNPLRPMQSNNTTGVIGVRRAKTAWGATWVEKGRQHHRSFAIEKFGDNEAFRLACRARAEAETRMYGRVFQDILNRKRLAAPPPKAAPKKPSARAVKKRKTLKPKKTKRNSTKRR